jgi:CheY-like chemotaxis protein
VSPSVLYIDDAASNLFVVELMAQDNGIAMDTASTGYEGLTKINEQEYKLILCDIRLPDISGYEILKQIRNGESNRYTPVVAFTADITLATREKIVEHGFTDYLRKPFDHNDLMRRFSVYVTVEENIDTIIGLSYYTKGIHDNSQLILTKKMILSDLQGFEKGFCHAWIQGKEQELHNQLNKIELVCENLRLTLLLTLIGEFKKVTVFQERELILMKIKKSLLLIYKQL